MLFNFNSVDQHIGLDLQFFFTSYLLSKRQTHAETYIIVKHFA